VFQLRLECSRAATTTEEGDAANAASAKQFTLNLCLVDLVGSENIKESGCEGDRLTETKAINTSLSHLKTVIVALAAGKAHVPFRNSRLTFLLQPSMSGSSKCLMFVCASPREGA
jgi:kinesin family protein C1